MAMQYEIAAHWHHGNDLLCGVHAMSKRFVTKAPIQFL